MLTRMEIVCRSNRLGGSINRLLPALGDRTVILLLTEVTEEGDCQRWGEYREQVVGLGIDFVQLPAVSAGQQITSKS